MNNPRLIDANDAKKLICGIDSEFAKFVDEIPTAYDIDKVVEQLEELIEGCQELYEDSIKLDDLQMRTASRNQAIALKQAIEIVKGGAE